MMKTASKASKQGKVSDPDNLPNNMKTLLVSTRLDCLYIR